MKTKIGNLEMKAPLHLLQTTLMIDTLNVYECENVEFYKSTCGQAVVVKELFDTNGDDVFIFGLKVNPKVRKNLKLKK